MLHPWCEALSLLLRGFGGRVSGSKGRCTVGLGLATLLERPLPEAVLTRCPRGLRARASAGPRCPEHRRRIVTLTVSLCRAERFFHVHCRWAEFQFPFFFLD